MPVTAQEAAPYVVPCTLGVGYGRTVISRAQLPPPPPASVLALALTVAVETDGRAVGGAANRRLRLVP